MQLDCQLCCVFKGVFFPYCYSIMPANCSCHPAEVPYKNDVAGHRPPSSPLATPPSWGDVTPAATALASIWARIHVQVCVPVTCQKSCISQRKTLVGRPSKSKDKHSRAQQSSSQILKWRCSPGTTHTTGEKTHPSKKKKKKKDKFVSSFHVLKSHPNTSSLLFAVHRWDFHTLHSVHGYFKAIIFTL